MKRDLRAEKFRREIRDVARADANVFEHERRRARVAAFDARLADPSAQALEAERSALGGWDRRLAAIPVDYDDVAETIRKRHAHGKNFSIVVVSEGTELPGLADRGETDQFGHVTLSHRGVGDTLGREIQERTGFETRVTVLGHVQRGGTPTARDRILATRFGLKAADLALAGEFGQMAALRGDEIVAVPLAEATAELKLVPRDWYAVASAFFG